MTPTATRCSTGWEPTASTWTARHGHRHRPAGDGGRPRPGGPVPGDRPPLRPATYTTAVDRGRPGHRPGLRQRARGGPTWTWINRRPTPCRRRQPAAAEPSTPLRMFLVRPGRRRHEGRLRNLVPGRVQATTTPCFDGAEGRLHRQRRPVLPESSAVLFPPLCPAQPPACRNSWPLTLNMATGNEHGHQGQHRHHPPPEPEHGRRRRPPCPGHPVQPPTPSNHPSLHQHHPRPTEINQAWRKLTSHLDPHGALIACPGPMDLPTRPARGPVSALGPPRPRSRGHTKPAGARPLQVRAPASCLCAAIRRERCSRPAGPSGPA